MPKFKIVILTIIRWQEKHLRKRYFILLLSMIIGLSGGIVALILKTSVFFIHNLLIEGKSFSEYNLMIFIYPIIGITLTVLFSKYIIHDKVKHSIATILNSISRRNSLMKAHKIFSSIIGGIITAGFGGSIGLESPIISSGSSIGSNIGKIFKMNYKEVTLLLACGAAGAISAIFHTPVAAIVFAIEVLLLDLTRFTLIPLLIASISGAIVNVFFHDEILFEFTLRDPFEVTHTVFYILLGLISGLMSVYFTRAFLKTDKILTKFTEFKRLIIGGGLLGILLFVFPQLYGEGYDIIKAIFAGDFNDIIGSNYGLDVVHNTILFFLFFLILLFTKVIATSITISSGGIGGIIAPTLFTGALVGMLFSHTLNFAGINLNVSESNFALVGMAGLISGVLHAPLTGIFLIAETTRGYELIVPIMLTSTISFVTTKYFEPNSIFTIQLAKKGQLITHNKDKAAIAFMNLNSVIEKDLLTIHVDSTLGDLVKIISKAQRNLFPVIDDDNILIGIINMNDIREIMFNKDMYENTFVVNLMNLPPAYISINDSMSDIMNKFRETGAWNLPVIDNAKYIGLVSKSKLFSEYRNLLMELSDE
ncbi:MAG: chloride channel protein [Bacteroidota bacterium]|nr:chloride channel protein [Bacteroidota bacterium]